ncbi:MAG TPA: M64 family metallopeptidase [Planctomycetota bacterium]|nr:M64 family metallopeptidase [Planctomycetota bacterium]
MSRRSRIAAWCGAVAAAVLGSAAAAPAQAPTVTTVLNNGPTQARYDIVILAEGYQAFEQPLFNQNVQTFLTALFQKQPYQTFASYYNVHTVFRASVDSGADHPELSPPVYKDTVYNASYNTGGVVRCVYIQNTSLALADAALAPANEGRVLVFVNDPTYGGCAATFACSYNGSSMTEVQIHEIGHSLGQVADEYDYPNNTYTGSEPSAVNITTSPTGQKWSIWHGSNGISAFQGAGYYLYGLYRPRNNCLMRTLGQTLCSVCAENITKLLNGIVQTIDQSTPAASSVALMVPNLQAFSISHIVPAANNPAIGWKLDGAIVPGATSPTFVLDSTTLSQGAHSLQVSVKDQTAFVRSDPANTMTDTHTWQVTISDPTAAQLRVPSFTSNLLWVTRGSPVTFTTEVANDGPAAAGPFTVEYFLTPTTPWTAQDIYLGSDTVANLAAMQTTTLQHPVQLPWRLLPQVYYVYAVVDRNDAVHESNETDNQRLLALIGQAGPCVTKLEYDDPLLYPLDSATVSVGAGGSVHPTVVAPCADPTATLYLIAWTASGTSPGVPLSPTVTLPLNPDSLTQIGLGNLNSPILGQFLGILDAQGLGHATFALPPTSGLGPMQTHFAAVLLGATELFSAATNPVELVLGM